MKLVLVFRHAVLAALLLLTVSTKMAAQRNDDWMLKMQDPDVNFWELQKEFNAYWEGRTDRSKNGYKIFKRWEYLNKYRAAPDGKLPAPTHVLKEYNRYMADAATLRSASGAWNIIGPQAYHSANVSGQGAGKGRVNAIAIHPTDTNMIFVGSPSGGIWKSINGGTTWTNLSANLPHLGVSAILIHPSNPDIIYIGTGDRDASDAPGLGVYKTTNGGATWAPANAGMGNATVGMMVMHPTNPDILTAATKSGIYKTTNGGAEWSLRQSGDFRDIKLKPGPHPNILYASKYGGQAEFWRSTNRGDAWNLVSLDTADVGLRIVIGVTPADTNRVYLVRVKRNSFFKELLTSTNSGETFTSTPSNLNILGGTCDGQDQRSQAFFDLCIEVDRIDANTVYVGGIDMWKTSDAGMNWTPVTNWIGKTWSGGEAKYDCAATVHADHHFCIWSPHHTPARLYLGHDGGIDYTANGGTSWTEISNNLPIGQMYKIGQSPHASNTLSAGFQDNGTSATNNGGTTFTQTIGGDGFETQIDYTTAKKDSICYGSTQSGNIRRTFLGPLSAYATIPMPQDDKAPFNTIFMLHRTNPNTMFTGRQNVWRSRNIRATPIGDVAWEKISNLPLTDRVFVDVIEHSQADTNTMYFSHSRTNLYRSDNVNATAASVTWTSIPNPSGFMVTDIEAHPTNSNTVYITAGNAIYKSTNKGAAWTNISGNLPNLPINCLVLDKTAPEDLYIGNQTGVWYKNATMTNWILFSSGLPPVDVRELEVYYDANNADNNRISAATFGRGAWQSDLAVVNVIDPSNFAATPFSPSQINLSWTRNAANNDVLIATNSTTIFGVPADGTAYMPGNTLPGGGTVVYVGNPATFNHAGLTTGTNYCYKIWSVNASNQYSAGLPPVCASTGINWTGAIDSDWFKTGNWATGKVPTAFDGAYIPAGRPNYPLINAAGAICKDLTIEPMASVGMDANAPYTLRVAGDWTNNGTFTRGIGTVEFMGTDNLQKITGTSTTDFHILKVAKGSIANILDALSPISLNAPGNEPLLLESGTFRLSNALSNITAIRSNGAAQDITAVKRIWVAAGTFNLNARTFLNGGELRITGGTFTIGNGDEIQYLNNGRLVMTSGALNVDSGIWGNDPTNRSSTGAFDISGGTITLGKMHSYASRGLFEVNAACNFTMSGGTIILENPNASGQFVEYYNLANTSSVTGGTVQVGNASTLASKTFRFQTSVPIYNLTVNAANAPTAQLTTPLTVLNDVTIAGGTLDANNQNLAVGRHFTNNGTFTPGTGTVTFNGTVNQNLGGSAATTFNNMTLSNSAGLTLNGSVSATVNGTLNLSAGVISTGANKVIIPASGSVARTAGHIFGNLQKNVATGSDIARTFEIGDAAAANYTPVAVTFAAVSTAGDLTAKAVSTDHPSIASASLNASKSVNRHWSLTNAGTAFNSYSAVFNFLATDLDAGTDPNALNCGKYDNPSWTYPTVGTRTATSTAITGATSFSDFQLAETASCVNPTVPTLSASVNPICAGQSTTLSIASGALNGATAWQWYAGSCGGTLVGSGTNITVSPGSTTTYHVRGEGGCVTPGTCGNITVTVNPLPTMANAGSNQTGAATCGQTQVTLAGNAPSVGTGQWSIVSGTGGSIATPSSPTSVFSGTAGSTYTLRWTITAPSCPASTSDMVVSFSPNPTTANAGPANTFCGTNGTMAGNAPIVGSGAWSQVSGPGTATFNVPNSPTSGVTVSTPGTYTLRWTISNAPCAASTSDVTLTFTNNSATANAGPNQTGAATCGQTQVTLAGNTPGVGTGQWSIVSGTGGSIADPSSPTSMFSGTAGSTYTLRWTVTAPACPASTSDMVVTFNRNPTAANAGSANTFCGTSGTMAGNAPSIGTGTWSQVSGPGTATFNAPNSPTSGVTVSTPGAYTLRWTISNAPCAASTSDVALTFTANSATANAGPNQTGAATCGQTQVTLAGNTPSVGTGQWSIVSGTGGSIAAPSSPTSMFSGTAGSTYTLRWTVTAPSCPASTSDMVVTFNQNPTAANAGSANTFCSTSGTMAGNAPSVGTGTWSQVSGPGTATFSAPNSPTSGVTVSMPGAYTLRWTISNAPCAASTSDVTLTFTDNSTTANAGPNQTSAATCGQTQVTLAGNTPSSGTGQWSIVSGTGGSIATPSSPTSTFSGVAGSAYTLRWTITAPSCPASTSDMVVTFNQNPTAANAGSANTFCGTNGTMAGNAPSVGTGTWSLVSGPGTATFGAPNSPTSGVSVSTTGAYTLRWTVSNAPCAPSTSDVVITFTPNPSANAGPDKGVCGLSGALEATVPSIGMGTWSQISGPGTATFGTPTSPISSVSVSATGAYTLRWTVSNAPCPPSTDDVVVTFSPSPSTANAGPDQTGAATCNQTQVTLAANTPSVGTGQWSIVAGTGGTIAAPGSPTSTFSGTAGNTYTLRWTISSGACPASTDDMVVTFNQNPTTANAGPDNSVCGTGTTLAGNAPNIGTGIWSLVSGPGAATFGTPNSPTSSVNVSASGAYTFRWTVLSGACPASTDDVVITFSTGTVTANAGPDNSVCGLSTTMAGSLPGTASGTWSQVSGPGTATFGAPNSSNSIVSVSVTGAYTLRWTVSSASCPVSTDDVVVTFGLNPSAANAGPDQTSATCGQTQVTLAGNTPGSGTGTWSIVSGTGGSIAAPNTPASSFSGTAGNTYTLRWTVSAASCPISTDDMVVTFKNAPTFSACPADMTVSATANCTAPATYIATALGTEAPSVSYAFSGATPGTGSGTGSGASFTLGTTTVTLTATNSCGTSTCVFDVDVETGEMNLQGNGMDIPDGSSTPSLADHTDFGTTTSNVVRTFTIQNVGTSPFRVSGIDIGGADAPQFHLSAPPPSSPIAPGQSVTFNVTYAPNSTGVHNAIVTVLNGDCDEGDYDFEIQGQLTCAPPTAFSSCPSNMVVNTLPNSCVAVPTYDAAIGVASPAYTHIFEGATTVNLGTGTGSGSTFNKGITTVEVRGQGIGSCGVARCIFTVEVKDERAPNLTCPANMVVPTAGTTCSATVAYTHTVADNCTASPVLQHAYSGATTKALTSGTGTGSVFNPGISTVTLRATDEAGLSKTCSFRVIVNDTKPPVISACSATQVNAVAGQCVATVMYSNPTFTDNCAPANGTTIRISGLASGSNFPVGTTNLIFRAIDARGNSSTCVMAVTVVDNQPPSITCPSAATATGSGTPCTAIVHYPVPTASDNCSVGTLSPFLFQGLASGSVFPSGTTVNIWRAITPNGQVAECTVPVTVSCPQNKSNGGEERAKAEGAWDFSLNPNPTNEAVQIALMGTSTVPARLAIFDARGRLVWEQTTATGEQTLSVDVSNWAVGVYLVSLRGTGTVVTKRLVVTH